MEQMTIFDCANDNSTNEEEMMKDFELFKERKIKAKSIFTIERIGKVEAYEFVRKYHYLGDAKFFCVWAYGLFYKGNHQLVGCATYSNPQGIVALKSWFNLDNQTKKRVRVIKIVYASLLKRNKRNKFFIRRFYQGIEKGK